MEQYKIGGELENSDIVYNEVVYNVGNYRILIFFEFGMFDKYKIF